MRKYMRPSWACSDLQNSFVKLVGLIKAEWIRMDKSSALDLARIAGQLYRGPALQLVALQQAQVHLPTSAWWGSCAA